MATGLAFRLASVFLSRRCALPIFRCSNFTTFKILSLSFQDQIAFFRGPILMSMIQRPIHRSFVCSSSKEGRKRNREKAHLQDEKRRLLNKARKTRIRNCFRRVFKALDLIEASPTSKPSDMRHVDELISSANEAVEDAVQKGTLHKNTGARRKARLVRRKNNVEIKLGWRAPALPEEIKF